MKASRVGGRWAQMQRLSTERPRGLNTHVNKGSDDYVKELRAGLQDLEKASKVPVKGYVDLTDKQNEYVLIHNFIKSHIRVQHVSPKGRIILDRMLQRLRGGKPLNKPKPESLGSIVLRELMERIEAKHPYSRQGIPGEVR